MKKGSLETLHINAMLSSSLSIGNGGRSWENHVMVLLHFTAQLLQCKTPVASIYAYMLMANINAIFVHSG